jgi:hypothetical protein
MQSFCVGCQGFRRRIGRSAVAMSALFIALSSGIAQAGPHTPAVGSAERQAIFDAMRALGDNHTRVFIVQSLKVEDGWAWASAIPQSPDGSQHFEPESALLENIGGHWRVLDQPCGEGDCDAQKEVARIRAAYPQAPADIFPQ